MLPARYRSFEVQIGRYQCVLEANVSLHTQEHTQELPSSTHGAHGLVCPGPLCAVLPACCALTGMDDDSVHVVCSLCQKEVPRCNLTTHKLRCPGAKRQSPSPPRLEQLSHDEPMEQQQQQRRQSIVDLTNDSPLPSPPPRSTGPLPPPPTLGPLSPPAAAVAGEHWECPYCSFHNEMVNEVRPRVERSRGVSSVPCRLRHDEGWLIGVPLTRPCMLLPHVIRCVACASRRPVGRAVRMAG